MQSKRSGLVAGLRLPRLVAETAIVIALLGGSVSPARADFARVGPGGLGGYPGWYQDTTGLALEFCSPSNQSELDGGWCLLLPADTAAPEAFPAPFSEEHFYWAATADADPSGTVRALLVLALEGAFSVGPVIPGDQIVFGRLRIVLNPLPASGTYTVYTPFGKFVFTNQAAGDRLFFTEDIGINCGPGDFTCALASKVGPFLLPSSTPGGAEMPPVSAQNPTPDTDPAHFGGAFAPTPYPGTGKKYVADPARIGPVTGSPLPPYTVGDGTTRNANIFRIEGPGGFVLETSSFNLMGRVFEGAIAGRVTIDRASYARSATARSVDVFATGLPSTQGRIPGAAAPARVTPALQYFDAPCVVDPATGALSAPAGSPIQMLAAGTSYWGQSQPATIPLEVCVTQSNAVDAGGQRVPAFFPAVLGDTVVITEALYDPATQTLSVKATSSDQLSPPTLTLAGFGTLTNGAVAIRSVVAPPAKVRVTSTAFGSSELQVTTGVGASGPTATVPIAANDAGTVLEDSGTTRITVLANDTIGGQPVPAGSLVTLVAQARLGTAVVNVDGSIGYTPRANANGADSFSYTVAVNGVVSNAATVAVTITPVNDPPVAINDTFTAFANRTAVLPVLANDVDVDGPTDIVAATAVTLTSSPAGSTVTLAAATGGVSFLAGAPGTYTFTYRARDAAGAVSATAATVTVNVAAAETVTITQAEFRTSSARLRVSGTIAPVTNPPQRLEIRWANGTNTVSVVDTPVADAAGNWATDLRGVSGIQDPRNSGATQVVVTSPAGGRAVTGITVRR